MPEIDRSQDGHGAAADVPRTRSAPVDDHRGATLADTSIDRERVLAYRAVVAAAYAEHASARPDADADARHGARSAGEDRPDMAERYPGRYARPAGPPPSVEGPGEHPRRWVGDIYPGRDRNERPNNCGECARAVDATSPGPRSAPPNPNSTQQWETRRLQRG